MAAQAGQLELNVMMPIIAHNLNEMVHVTIGAVNAFVKFCLGGHHRSARESHRLAGQERHRCYRAQSGDWLCGGAELVKDAMKRNMTIRDVAAERIAAGTLTKARMAMRITLAEVDASLDLYKLTEGGLGGPAGGG